MKEPTKEQIDAVLRHLPTLKKKGFKASKWHGGEEDENGVITIQWEEHSPVVGRLIRDLHTHRFIEPFDCGG
jgi:hypothetical protein